MFIIRFCSTDINGNDRKTASDAQYLFFPY